ncbi:12618_t:CDS:2, partial [Dentiscutata erythropus]
NEFLIGEVVGTPFDEKKKSKDDKQKLFRMLKDIYDDIFKHFYESKKLKIYVLDKPSFGLYRTRKVDQMILPVSEDDDRIITAIDSLLARFHRSCGSNKGLKAPVMSLADIETAKCPATDAVVADAYL